ncbi:MAG TPA: phage tail protein [Solimonas sp.]|nr:phage tail protein [Solimonas sp.]
MADDDAIAWGTPTFGFRFLVEFEREPIDGRGDGTPGGPEQLCAGAFAEITGLEASMEVKAIKEGGQNYGVHQRGGQVNFATVVLKRGMTSARDLWLWWKLFAGATDPTASEPVGGAYAHRLTVRIAMQDAAQRPLLKWRLDRAMPVKFKAGDFNARAADVAIEELHLVHEGLYMEPA